MLVYIINKHETTTSDELKNLNSELRSSNSSNEGYTNEEKYQKLPKDIEYNRRDEAYVEELEGRGRGNET